MKGGITRVAWRIKIHGEKLVMSPEQSKKSEGEAFREEPSHSTGGPDSPEP